MKKLTTLKQGDTVAVISLSSGILGESFVKHQLELGTERLRQFGLNVVFMPNSLKGIEFLHQNPQARAEDLKLAFMDDNIKGIICAIGGNDTYKTLPYLLNDNEFIEAVKNNPKIFTGFSDSTINHLMFYKLGLTTFYGPNFLGDFAELDLQMLPYTKQHFNYLFEQKNNYHIHSSKIWYKERKDFSEKSLNTSREECLETHNYEVLKGLGIVTGNLLGGCIESLYDQMIREQSTDYDNNLKVFPSIEQWKNKILFIETSEEKPTPENYEKMLNTFKDFGIFEAVSAVIVGKPQDEVFYEEYKESLKKVITNKPILYNVNFGHALPRITLPINTPVEINFDLKSLILKLSPLVN